MEKLTLEQAIEKYGITPEKHKEIFENMYNKAFISTFMKSDLRSKEKAKERPTAVFIGGQVGAGKSNLIILSAGEFFALGEDYILIDDDQYRKFYPNAEFLSKHYPTFYTDITALGSSVITPKIMKAAIDGEYNFIQIDSILDFILFLRTTVVPAPGRLLTSTLSHRLSITEKPSPERSSPGREVYIGSIACLMSAIPQPLSFIFMYITPEP